MAAFQTLPNNMAIDGGSALDRSFTSIRCVAPARGWLIERCYQRNGTEKAVLNRRIMEAGPPINGVLLTKAVWSGEQISAKKPLP